MFVEQDVELGILLLSLLVYPNVKELTGLIRICVDLENTVSLGLAD